MPDTNNESSANGMSTYIPIHLKSLRPSSMVDFDLYLKDAGKHILYRSRRIMITAQDIERLMDNRVVFLYIHSKDRKIYRGYLEKNIESVIRDRDIPLERKSEVLYESAIHVVEDLFNNPRSGEVFSRSNAMVHHTVHFILTGPDAFANLLKIRTHDYYTYTHSVNVCVFLVSLAQALGTSDPTLLHLLGQGGLLHDLGKSRIPIELLNKHSALNKQEWELIKRHPAEGMEIAEENGEHHEITLAIIGQHHERLSGSGYPYRLTADQLSQFARMASIADVYDAITTNRSYAKMQPPAEAIRIMLNQPDELDRDILLHFIKLLAVK